MMSSLGSRHLMSIGARHEPFRARSMGLCLVGHHPVLPKSGDSYSLGLKETFMLVCPRSPWLVPRSVYDDLLGVQ